MSEYTDKTLSRYLDQQPGMREALLNDPMQHAQAEMMRQMLEIAERAMDAEDISLETQRRVVNRIVWGEPEGVHRHSQLIQQMQAGSGLPPIPDLGG